MDLFCAADYPLFAFCFSIAYVMETYHKLSSEKITMSELSYIMRSLLERP